ncbi:MAG: energy-coupling factor transporter ATPase [Bacilli bacterium]
MKIEFKNVYFNYDDIDKAENNEEISQVVNNVSFTINQGEMVAILGHNGSGKSTIAKLIMGLLEPNKGYIYLNDIDVLDENLATIELDRLHAKMGIIFQNPDNQFVGMTVEDDIAFGLENHNVSRNVMIEKINKYASLVGMSDYLKSNPEDLSGGQKQRVAIAGVLAMDTEVIIFDESTSMLDPKGTKEIIDIIKKLKTEYDKTIITITHNLEEAVFADRVMVLNEGQIVLDGTPQEVLRQKDILEQSGLKLIDSLALIDELKDINFNNKEKVLEKLWELTFKM